MEGALMKWTNVMKGWQYRWFVLDENAGLLSYYTTKEKMARGARRGCVRLKGAILSIDDDECTFNITVDGKMFHFQAQDSVERDRWIRALEDTRMQHAQVLQKRWDPKIPVPTVEDFNKKLTETDAFLQIMIDQVESLGAKIVKYEGTASQGRIVNVHAKAKEMLETIKHSIVLLQIAKNVAHPVNGIYQPPINQCTPRGMEKPFKRMWSTFQEDSLGFSDYAASLFDTEPVDGTIVTDIEPALECVESNLQSHNLRTNVPPKAGSIVSRGDLGARPPTVTTADNTPMMTTVVTDSPSLETLGSPFVPETSYSSSEDEDFYDAFEDTALPPRSNDDGNASSNENQQVSRRGFLQPLDSNNDSSPLMEKAIDFDAIYEDDEEEDLGSVESHGSVISHLLSQVRLGMDLTKVVLPTFILERRSLLEMYADFFAHPELFVSIADHTDPRDRMVQVIRWYLSAFHAGRKSSVAKKPYNPILGEIFKCYWDIPGTTGSTEKATDGPIPWATKGQLAFVAEQVSHHPPVSALYAEHFEKRITLGAHAWTKSKFLGLSIGVHMIGQGCISVLDYDEEYILTFPNGYGRSILTVPWIELGGTIAISCAKTGYSANVEFITKPFYGGKKHRIMAEVFQPNDKKPFLTVTGEWNGVMNAKWTDDGRSEVFVDTTSIPITKKKVLPVAEQESYESRRLWKDVTAGLKFKHIDQATEAKFKLEQRQREEARERKEKGLNWETRVFHEVGGNWIYDRPLQKRIPSDVVNTFQPL